MKALVVDDDLALSDVLSFTMRRAGFQVITAHDGKEALDLWQSESPDLIILDLNLPKRRLFGCKWILPDRCPYHNFEVRSDEEDVADG
jgi:DNA-binding response OmpR family regulator